MVRSLPRLVLLLCVVAALVFGVRAARPGAACATGVGACAEPGLPPCGGELGGWRIVRPRDAGLHPDRSHSACVLERDAEAAAADGRAPAVSVVPQPPWLPGDTLLSLAPAPRRDAQRASVRLTAHERLPDHWAFAVAGTFLDRGATTSCEQLAITPPVNAGYALIGGNWIARPHGFYFERLADACVYDGRDPDCPGDAPYVAHELVPGESYLVTLELRRADDGRWWLAAEIALADAAGGVPRPLGSMRLPVDEPCWLAARDTGRALVVVIPNADEGTHSEAASEVRVEVADFAWR
ncbi:MAG TPA: hypothetical protein VIS07_10195 [Candidatus Binatia bacterium]